MNARGRGKAGSRICHAQTMPLLTELENDVVWLAVLQRWRPWRGCMAAVTELLGRGRTAAIGRIRRAGDRVVGAGRKGKAPPGAESL